jgi:hypothetical protein
MRDRGRRRQSGTLALRVQTRFGPAPARENFTSAQNSTSSSSNSSGSDLAAATHSSMYGIAITAWQ